MRRPRVTRLARELSERYVLVRIFLVSREGGIVSSPPTVIQNVFLASRRRPIGSKAQETPPLSSAANQWILMFLLGFLLLLTSSSAKEKNLSLTLTG